MKKQRIGQDITVDPNVRFGKPVIAGTRVPVDLIVGKIAGGMTLEEVAKQCHLILKILGEAKHTSSKGL